MYTGTLPPASIWGTWSENIEVWSVDDDDLMDLTEVTEITLKLRDPYTMVEELTLTMSGGDIVIPSPGIIQWRVEVDAMRTLNTKLYEVIMTLEDETDTVPLILGAVSIVE
jgi:hypothetical protein